MDKTDIYAGGVFVLGIAFVVGIICAYVYGSLDLFVAAVFIICIAAIVAFLVLYLTAGTYYFVKNKDDVHGGSSLGVGDISEVDREMEKRK